MWDLHADKLIQKYGLFDEEIAAYSRVVEQEESKEEHKKAQAENGFSPNNVMP